MIASIILSVFFSYWAYSQYRVNQSTAYMVTVIVSAAVALGLVYYGFVFNNKVKE